MDESAAFATKAEVEQVRKEQKQMVIELKVLGGTVNALTREVAHLAEKTSRMDARIDQLEDKIDALQEIVTNGFAELRLTNASMLSAILSIKK